MTTLNQPTTPASVKLINGKATHLSTPNSLIFCIISSLFRFVENAKGSTLFAELLPLADGSSGLKKALYPLLGPFAFLLLLSVEHAGHQNHGDVIEAFVSLFADGADQQLSLALRLFITRQRLVNDHAGDLSRHLDHHISSYHWLSPCWVWTPGSSRRCACRSNQWRQDNVE